MNYSYAKLGVTCDTSMSVLSSNTKFIPPNSKVYTDSVKLNRPLKIDRPEVKIENLSKPSVEIPSRLE